LRKQLVPGRGVQFRNIFMKCKVHVKSGKAKLE
jgi:hypothetical protein